MERILRLLRNTKPRRPETGGFGFSYTQGIFAKGVCVWMRGFIARVAIGIALEQYHLIDAQDCCGRM